MATLAAAFVFSGCAASLAANKKSPGKVENGMFQPTRPPEANYGPDPALVCPERGVNGAIADMLKQKMGDKAPPQDGRLCAIADTLLGWPGLEKNELPPDVVRMFLSHYFGLPTAFRTMQLTVLETTSASDIATALVDSIGSFASTAQAPKWGFYSEVVTGVGSGSRQAMAQGATSSGGKTRIALVLYDDNAVFDPVPRKLQPNTSAQLNGHLAGALKSPKVQVVDTVGKLEKSAPSIGQDFHAEIKCGDKPGKILVQIAGEVEGADVVAANFGVACGTELATGVALPGAEGPIDPPAAEKMLAERLNQDRTTAGLKPLNVPEALNKIARTIAENQAHNKGTSSSDLMAALKEADIATPLILESAASAFSAESAATKLSDSPPDRANQMRADLTDVGVGAARGPDVGGKPTIIVVELFVTQLPPPDPVAVKAKLYDAIAKKRADAGKTALEKDSILEDISQKYADAAAASGAPLPRDKESELMAPLYKASMTVNVLGGFVPTEEAAMNVAEQGSVLGDAKLIGVGVAVGRSPAYGKNSPFVMVLLGTRHAPPKAVTKKKKHK
ncbi:MAG TPA: CAP domain-containing protein [Myxococcales bacterium]|nr:CAP domain-containing protein [Myxococcales bacterium]